MKASKTNLIYPFLHGVYLDICELFPEYDFSYELETVKQLAESDPAIAVAAMARIGKAFEKALVTGKDFRYDEELFPNAEGCMYPRCYQYLWETVLHASGRPRYSFDDYTAALDSYKNMSPVAAMYHLQRDRWGEPSDTWWSLQALHVFLLRQFFLGLSKLSTLECLYFVSRRGPEVLRESNQKAKSVVGRQPDCWRCPHADLRCAHAHRRQKRARS